MKIKFIEFLKDLGLTDNEAKIYFASLHLGPSTIIKIAEFAEIKRTTVYSVAESLQSKGLLNIEVKGFKKLYRAEDPSKLEMILEIQRKKLKDFLPEFQALYNLKGGESFIRYYSGLSAVKNVYENVLTDIKPRQDYLIMNDADKWVDLDERYFHDFVKRRAKLNINVRLLLQDSHRTRAIKQAANEHIKFLPPDTKLATNLTIIPQRVIINQLVPPVMAIVIENKSIIQMHTDTFNIIWNSLP